MCDCDAVVELRRRMKELEQREAALDAAMSELGRLLEAARDDGQ